MKCPTIAIASCILHLKEGFWNETLPIGKEEKEENR
jgi:hypothetical protein